MFKKKSIWVRSIGKLTCKPELSLTDVRQICDIAESFPIIDEIGDDGEPTGKKVYVPEHAIFGFWVALLSFATNYEFGDRDVWADIHTTKLTEKLAVFYRNYIDELYHIAMERIAAKAKEVTPINEASIFDGVAKELEGIDIGDVLETARAISQMSGKEIVEAAVNTEAP